MTELERRALLGDKRAQEECTRRGILLPCPFCGGKAMIEYDDIMPFEYSVFCEDCGVMPSVSEDKQVVISVWNTRPAPPIGRCVGCKYYNGLAECELLAECGGTNWVCGWFEPKENEEK
mgnify:CR=1 FL=1